MSTISLKFGVHTRIWPRIDFQPLEFNSEFYFWRFFFFLGGGGGGGARFAEFQQRVKLLGPYIKFKTCSGSQKKSFEIIILTDVRFVSLKMPTKMH